MKLAFVTVHVENIKTSIDFYEKILSMHVEKQFSHGETSFAFLRNEGAQLELIENKHEKPKQGNDAISIGFEVEDMDAFLDILKTNNIALESGPTKVEDNKGKRTTLLFFKDPNGVLLEAVMHSK